MLCMGIWVHPYSDTLLQVGGSFGGFGGRPEPKWCCNVMVEKLRLQQASNWIPHPYWMYMKCFGTLICCVWAYGSTLTVTVICLCTGCGVDLPKWYCYVMVEATTGFRLDFTSILDVYKVFWKVLVRWYGVYGHMGSPLTLTVIRLCRSVGGFMGFAGRPEQVWCHNHVMVEVTTCFRLDPISILDV